MIDAVVTTLVLGAGAVGIVALIRMERPVDSGRCAHCGYDVGAAALPRCPECGRDQQTPPGETRA